MNQTQADPDPLACKGSAYSRVWSKRKVTQTLGQVEGCKGQGPSSYEKNQRSSSFSEEQSSEKTHAAAKGRHAEAKSLPHQSSIISSRLCTASDLQHLRVIMHCKLPSFTHSQLHRADDAQTQDARSHLLKHCPFRSSADDLEISRRHANCSPQLLGEITQPVRLEGVLGGNKAIVQQEEAVAVVAVRGYHLCCAWQPFKSEIQSDCNIY